MSAAQVWWMLRWAGFDAAAVLDGGLDAWTEAGQPVTADVPDGTPATLTPRPRPELIADRDEVLAATDDQTVRLVDTLPEAHDRGEMPLYERPGHIPGAPSVPVFELLDASGRIAPHNEVLERHGGWPDARHHVLRRRHRRLAQRPREWSAPATRTSRSPPRRSRSGPPIRISRS